MVFIYAFIIGIPWLLVYFTVRKICLSRHIRKHGVTVQALVTGVSTRYFSKGSMDSVLLHYSDKATGKLYTAKATTAVHQYKVGDAMPLTYLPANPAKYAFDKGQGYWVALIFSLMLALFMVFAVYKINELVTAGNYQFNGF